MSACDTLSIHQWLSYNSYFSIDEVRFSRRERKYSFASRTWPDDATPNILINFFKYI